MRRAILGALMGAGLVILAVGLFDAHGQVVAPRMPAPPTAGGDLIAMPTPMGEKGQMLTVIDPKQQTIGVYWIEMPSGKISLRSVRNIHYDLQMTDFNGDPPLPREIRLQLEQR